MSTIYLLLGISFIGIVVSTGTMLMVFSVRQSIDALANYLGQLLTSDETPLKRRVTIARDYELPDEMEAAMERRAQKPPLQ